MDAAFGSGVELDEDGIEDAFELVAEVPEKIRYVVWLSESARLASSGSGRPGKTPAQLGRRVGCPSSASLTGKRATEWLCIQSVA